VRRTEIGRETAFGHNQIATVREPLHNVRQHARSTSATKLVCWDGAKHWPGIRRRLQRLAGDVPQRVRALDDDG